MAQVYSREQAARQVLTYSNLAFGQIVYAMARLNASGRFSPEERERTITRLAEELQVEVDRFKYDAAADMAYVNEVRERVDRELVWLDVHKDLELFVTDTNLSPSDDAVSDLWNHLTRQFRAWERAPQPPRHSQEMLPTEFTPAQYAEARHRVKHHNRTIARAFQNDDEKPLTSAIQEMEGWSESYTDPAERWVMAQAVWHAAHESTRVGGTASAAFHAFRLEMLQQLAMPRPRPASEIVILGAHHENNLGERVTEYDQPRMVRVMVLLEDYANSYGRTERRLAAYQLDASDEPSQRIGYLPKDAPRRTGTYLATLHRPKGQKRLAGRPAPVENHEAG